MDLPKVSKKLLLIILAFIVLFVTPASAANNLVQPPASTSLPSNSSSKVDPIPTANENQGITPLPAPAGDPNIQQTEAGQVLGIGDLIGDFTECITHPQNCLGTNAEKLIRAGTYIVEHSLLIQFVGDVANDIIDTLMDFFSTGDQKEAYERFYDIATDPDAVGHAGVLGFAQSTTNILLAMPVPVSTSQYFASINPFKNAEASGADELKGNDVIYDVWKKIRDASYALSVVVLIVIGFMIMLRVPLNPRTVVTAQSAIPRIIIALLLITFSFAISGLMIDLTRIVATILNNLVAIPSQVTPTFIALFAATGLLIGLVWQTSIFGGAGLIIAIAVIAILLILGITMLIVFFVIIYKLVMRYVIFLLLTMFAPFFFLIGALPGAEGVIINWFKRVAAALIAIPATGLVLHLSFAIGFSTFQGFGQITAYKDITELLIIPGNFIGGALGGALAWVAAAPIIGLGLFFFATKVPDIVDEMFGIRPLAPRAGISPLVLPAAVLGAGRSVTSIGKTYGGIETLEHAAGVPKGARGPVTGAIEKGFKGFPKVFCLPGKSLIDTPLGTIAISKLKEGLLVWSTSLRGERIAVRILLTVRRSVSHHLVAHLRLKDGRDVFVSPDHPTADGRRIVDLTVGSIYDGTMVASNKLAAYKGKYTFDILPDSPTGHYWADGILMGSTLRNSLITIIASKLTALVRSQIAYK